MSLSTDVSLPGGAHPPVPFGDNNPAPQAPAIGPSPDLDDASLAELRRQAEAEDGQQGQQPQPQGPRPAPTPPAPAGGGQPIMVPKARLDEVLAALRERDTNAEEWRNRALYMEGALATLRDQPRPAAAGAGQEPAAPAAQPTVQQLIAAEEAKMVAAAQQFDLGNMTAEALLAVNMAANRAISDLRENALTSRLMSVLPQPRAGLADAQILDAQTANLEANHPWCEVLTQREWAWLENWGISMFANMGQPVQNGNTADALKLRKLLAQLTDVIGPWLFPSRIAAMQPKWDAVLAARRAAAEAFAQPQPQGGNPAPARGGQPQPQRQPAPAAPVPNALARFAAHPPSSSNMGLPDAGSGEVTEEQVEQMTSEEIMALPAAVRARFT